MTGIIGSDSLDWNKTLGKYDSNDRATEFLQDIIKAIKENPDSSVTYSMPEK
ncbi:hypothetical protein [Bacillus sp. NPDC093026]|uniref:hypothetical protein n=1 Tax=Bacillus sp. NPDC093026 TaxID=3363948 RepID=UPI0037F94D72